MKVKELNFDDYPHTNIFVLMPKNFSFNRGATFPAGHDDAVLRVFGEEELYPEDGVIPDPEGGTLTLRLNRDIDIYKKD